MNLLRRTLPFALCLTSTAACPALGAGPRSDGERSAQAWQAFRARYGEEWIVDWDAVAKVPATLWGEGIPLVRGPLDASVVDAAVREFLAANSDLFHVDAYELVGAPSLHGSVWYATYQLVHGGLPIDEATRVDVRVKPNGVLALVTTHRIPRLIEASLEATLTADAAETCAASELPFEGGPYACTEPRLEIWVDDSGFGRLAWRFAMRNGRLDLPISNEYVVSARGAEPVLLETRNRVHEVDVIGNVSANVHAGDPTTAIVLQPLANLRVDVPSTGASGYTDAAGNFRIPCNGAAPVGVTTQFLGRSVDVNSHSGPDSTFSGTATPGTPFNIVLNPTPGETTNAEADGYLQTDREHTWITNILGSIGLPDAFPVRVNDATATCAAFYEPGAGTIFYRTGGGCNNSAYDSVLSHEYGHAIDDAIGGITHRGLSEGIADMIAMYRLGDPIVGRNFFQDGRFVRTGENTRQWPATECGSEIHCVGETFMGFAWQARQNLIASLGAGPGVARAEYVFLNALFGNGPDIPAQVLDTYVQDDDDGNLVNGVPDQTELDAAADFHSLPHPRARFVSIVHTPLANTSNSTADHVVRATVTSSRGPIAWVRLAYAPAGSTSFTTVFMTPTGTPNEYAATIPAATFPCPSAAVYAIGAADTQGSLASAPSDAPTTLFQFRVGAPHRLFFDDFEHGVNGWTHGFNRIADDWEQGPPNQQQLNRWDPLAAFSGSNVWGNDLGRPMFNGDYPNAVDNFLTSPTLNATGRSRLHLIFQRWLTVDAGAFDQAQVKVNGTTVWHNPTEAALVDTAWTQQDVDISAQADGHSAVSIQFTMTSDSVTTFGGWNIDDVSVESLEASGTLAIALSNPSPHLGTPETLTYTGVPGARVFLLLARATGSQAFPIPGGPTVVTGLRAPIRVKHMATLGADGTFALHRTVPSTASLVGQTFSVQAVEESCGGAASNVLTVSVLP
jgi:hypothetical protein